MESNHNYLGYDPSTLPICYADEPMSGIEPLCTVDETVILTIELHWRALIGNWTQI